MMMKIINKAINWTIGKPIKRIKPITDILMLNLFNVIESIDPSAKITEAELKNRIIVIHASYSYNIDLTFVYSLPKGMHIHFETDLINFHIIAKFDLTQIEDRFWNDKIEMKYDEYGRYKVLITNEPKAISKMKLEYE